MGPAWSVPTRCSVIQAPASGRTPFPVARATVPRTSRAACARATPVARTHAVSMIRACATRALDLELPKVLGPELLQVALQVLGAPDLRLQGARAEGGPRCASPPPRALRSAGRLVFRQQLLGGEDRRAKPERDRDAVRRARVHDLRGPPDEHVQLRLKPSL